MSTHRELYFKIEKLSAAGIVLEEKTPVLIDGEVKVSYDDINRRTCNFTLKEPLPDDWMQYRWKPYYGQKINGTIVYTPLGVFIPLNPTEETEANNKITKYQGVDKATLLADAYSDIPITYTTGTSLKAIALDIFGRISETKLNLTDVPYTLATDFTFDEGITLEHILSTLVRSFTADWYYDRNGFATLEVLPVATARPVVYDFKADDTSIMIDETTTVDTSNYWNKVTVIGGQADTGIFRQTYTNTAQVTAAGRTITKFFTEDAATSQTQVNDLATQFLDIGSRLPRNIQIRNFPLADLEPKQVIRRGLKKYEVISFNIPLDLGEQQITAGEVL